LVRGTHRKVVRRVCSHSNFAGRDYEIPNHGVQIINDCNSVGSVRSHSGVVGRE